MGYRTYKVLTACAMSALNIAAFQEANAATVLTFEGIANNAEVGSFYAPNYTFSAGTIALIDSDAGGSGNFANEPSPSTAITFSNAASSILDVTNGFDTGFSFFYSSATAASVKVFSGLNATGTLLGQIDLAAQHTLGCVGDPNGTFCNWTNAGVSFAGLAHSIDFGGTANFTGYDNITFGSAVAGGGGVPEPATWAMMLLGVGAIGSALRRSRRTAVRLAD